MNVSGIGQNYNYWGTATNYMQKKTPVKEAISKTAKQPVNLSISDKGRDALREMVSKFEPAASEDTRAEILKEIREEKGTYDYSDIVNACGLSYVKLYAGIEERYENGSEQYYKPDGTLLTKQDEIDWLDKEYENEIAWQKACAKGKAQRKV